MKTTSHPFDTPAEAAAFLEGVEYVNDSAITAYIDPKDDCTVITEDEDATEDEEDPDLADEAACEQHHAAMADELYGTD